MNRRKYWAAAAALLVLLPTAVASQPPVKDADGWYVVHSEEGVLIEENDQQGTLVVSEDFVGYLSPGEMSLPEGTMTETSFSTASGEVTWRTGDDPLTQTEVDIINDYLAHVEYNCEFHVYTPWVGQTEVTARSSMGCWGPDHERHSLFARLQSDLSGDWLDVKTSARDRNKPGWIRITLSYRCKTNEYRNGWRNLAKGQIDLDNGSNRLYGPWYRDTYGYCS